MEFNQNHQNYAQVPESPKSWQPDQKFPWSWQNQQKPVLGSTEVLDGLLVQLALAQALPACWRNCGFSTPFWHAFFDGDSAIILKIMSQCLQLWPMRTQQVGWGASDIACCPPTGLGSGRLAKPTSVCLFFIFLLLAIFSADLMILRISSKPPNQGAKSHIQQGIPSLSRPNSKFDQSTTAENG